MGRTVALRRVEVADAAFILALRTDPERARHLSPTQPDLAAQQAWIRRCLADPGQAYFVIESRGHDRLGTVRLYDVRGDSFCWGSWILKRGGPPTVSMESALMVYHLGVRSGFARAHFDVRKDNVSVWRFHERLFGAVRVGETQDDWLYAVEPAALADVLRRHARWLPAGIQLMD